MSGSGQIRVLYDGDWPLCSREIPFLEKCDRGRGWIQVENIADPRFDAADYGLEMEQLMARIHAVMPNGALAEGVEAFRQAHAAVGLGTAGPGPSR